MNSWYAIDRLAAAHRADLAHEAARASLAVSGRRDGGGAWARTTSRLPRVSDAIAALFGRLALGSAGRGDPANADDVPATTLMEHDPGEADGLVAQSITPVIEGA